MMHQNIGRANAPASLAELERRWAAVRASMTEQGIDVLLMQNNNDFMGGAVKYFTDLPATNGYPVTVLFPRDDDMTLVRQGPFGLAVDVKGGDDVRRGIKRAYGTPNYVSANYTDRYDAELVEKALEPYAHATIGLLHKATLSFALMEHLMKGKCGQARFVDASDLVDAIKAIKSDEELGMIRATAAVQDAIMAAVAKGLQPGMRDQDVVGLASAVASSMGAEQGWYMAASGPVGKAAVMGPPHMQNRRIEAGDQFCLLAETNGPGGFFTELGRTFVLGRASDEMHDEFALILEAQKLTHGMLKPGASSAAIWDANNTFMRTHGRPEETRLYCHGQGYDMVERPLVRFDEPMIIAARMNLAVHPTYVTPGTYSWVCDNVIVHEDRVETIHTYPQVIVEL